MLANKTIKTMVIVITSVLLYGAFISPLHASLYQPEVNLSYKHGNIRGIGRVSILTPLFQRENALFYFNVIGMTDTKNAREGNLGFGYRRLFKDTILGAYGFYDIRASQYNHIFHQLTFGAELLKESFEARANLYLPLTKEKPIGSVRSTTLTGRAIITKTTQLFEKALYGFDIEVGGSVPGIRQLSLYPSYYFFNAEGVKPIHGVRGRGEYKFNDNIALVGEVSHDRLRKTAYYIGGKLTFKIGQSPSTPLSSLQQKMTQMPIRDVDIIIDKKAKSTIKTIHLNPKPSTTSKALILVKGMFNTSVLEDAHILGIKVDALETKIKEIGRKLILEHHPDKNMGSKISEKKFVKIHAAYERLLQRAQGQYVKAYDSRFKRVAPVSDDSKMPATNKSKQSNTTKRNFSNTVVKEKKHSKGPYALHNQNVRQTSTPFVKNHVFKRIKKTIIAYGKRVKVKQLRVPTNVVKVDVKSKEHVIVTTCDENGKSKRVRLKQEHINFPRDSDGHLYTESNLKKALLSQGISIKISALSKGNKTEYKLTTYTKGLGGMDDDAPPMSQSDYDATYGVGGSSASTTQVNTNDSVENTEGATAVTGATNRGANNDSNETEISTEPRPLDTLFDYFTTGADEHESFSEYLNVNIQLDSIKPHKKTVALSESQRAKIEEYLISRINGDNSIVYDKDSKGRGISHIAARIGSVKLTTLLYLHHNEAGYDIDNETAVPLQYAVAGGHLDVVKLILEHEEKGTHVWLFPRSVFEEETDEKDKEEGIIDTKKGKEQEDVNVNETSINVFDYLNCNVDNLDGISSLKGISHEVRVKLEAYIIDLIEKDNSLVFKKDERGRTLVHMAFGLDSVKLLEITLSHHPKALFDYIYYSFLSKEELYFIGEGRAFNYINNNDNIIAKHALGLEHHAAAYGRFDVFKYLVKKQGEKFAWRREFDVLRYAQKHNQYEFFERTFKEYPGVLIKQGRSAMNPILSLILDTQNVKLLQLAYKYNPNILKERDFNNVTLSHHAAEKGFTGFLEALIELDETVLDDVKRNVGKVIHVAARFGHADTVSLILKKRPDDIDSTDEIAEGYYPKGKTVFILAAERGYLDLVKLFISIKKDIYKDNLSGEPSVTNIFSTISYYNNRAGNKEGSSDAVFSCLLQLDMSILEEDDVFKKLFSFALHAGFAQSLDIILGYKKENSPDNLKEYENALIQRGAENNVISVALLKVYLKYYPNILELPDSQGRRLIHIAARNNLKLVKYILTLTPKAWSQKADKGVTPCHEAAQAGAVDILKAFLEHDHKTIDVVDDNGASLAHYAAMADKSDMLQYLNRIMKKALKKVDKFGYRPIHYTKSYLNLENRSQYGTWNVLSKKMEPWETPLTYILRLYPRALNYVDKMGNNFLHRAINNAIKFLNPSHVLEAFQYMVSQFPKLLVTPNNEGLTPLHVAFDKVELIKILMVYYSEQFLLEKKGKTCYQIALEKYTSNSSRRKEFLEWSFVNADKETLLKFMEILSHDNEKLFPADLNKPQGVSVSNWVSENYPNFHVLKSQTRTLLMDARVHLFTLSERTVKALGNHNFLKAVALQRDVGVVRSQTQMMLQELKEIVQMLKEKHDAFSSTYLRPSRAVELSLYISYVDVILETYSGVVENALVVFADSLSMKNEQESKSHIDAFNSLNDTFQNAYSRNTQLGYELTRVERGFSKLVQEMAAELAIVTTILIEQYNKWWNLVKESKNHDVYKAENLHPLWGEFPPGADQFKHLLRVAGADIDAIYADFEEGAKDTKGKNAESD